MLLRVCGASNDKPLYALQKTADGRTIFEDSKTGFLAVLKRIFFQVTGQIDYNLQHVTAHVASSIDRPFQGHCLGKVDKNFRVQLAERDIKIMGSLTRIDTETWSKVSRFGQALLQISNDNWYQSNDDSFCQTNQARNRHKEIYDRLQQDEGLKAACQRFVERCPSLEYRVIVRLALKGCHENSGSDGQIYK